MGSRIVPEVSIFDITRATPRATFTSSGPHNIPTSVFGAYAIVVGAGNNGGSNTGGAGGAVAFGFSLRPTSGNLTVGAPSGGTSVFGSVSAGVSAPAAQFATIYGNSGAGGGFAYYAPPSGGSGATGGGGGLSALYGGRGAGGSSAFFAGANGGGGFTGAGSGANGGTGGGGGAANGGIGGQGVIILYY
jgi:hypothetical protein